MMPGQGFGDLGDAVLILLDEDDFEIPPGLALGFEIVEQELQIRAAGIHEDQLDTAAIRRRSIGVFEAHKGGDKLTGRKRVGRIKNALLEGLDQRPASVMAIHDIRGEALVAPG
jgi:hypothetical protein